jgi:DNA-nicking Smr family endonuclease
MPEATGMKDEDSDDAALFRAAVRGTKPLKALPAPVRAARKVPARARFARAERQAVLAESLAAPGPFIDTQPGDELLFHRDGIAATVLRRLRRGDYRVESELDLHGLTGAQAVTEIGGFLQRAQSQGWRCVRIIHGKGMRSGPRGPVLKQAVNTLLRRTALVIAFASARARDGGTGATLVLLGGTRATRRST